MQGAGLLQAASEQPRAQIAASEQPRAQMQQWARFPLYLTQDVWNILQGSSERQLRSKKKCSVGQGSKVSKEYDKTRMCILKIKGKNKRYVCICPDESCNAYVFSHLSSYFSWLICYIGNVFLMYFLYFFTRDNIAKKNAYVCCFQSKRKPKNSYVYSCRDKETRMCIVLCKPRKQMYQCILPQTLKTIEKGTRFCATFAVSSRSFGCAVERLAAVIFSLLFFTPGGLCGGEFICTCTCNVCHERIQLATLTVAVLAKRKKEMKSLQFDNSTKKN